MVIKGDTRSLDYSSHCKMLSMIIAAWARCQSEDLKDLNPGLLA